MAQSHIHFESHLICGSFVPAKRSVATSRQVKLAKRKQQNTLEKKSWVNVKSTQSTIRTPHCSVGNVRVRCRRRARSRFKHCTMPRRGAQPSRQQQAFESLLDQEYAAQTVSANTGSNHRRVAGDKRGKQPNRTVVDKRGPDRLSGFALRDSLRSEQQSATYRSPAQEQLNSMFGGVLDESIISTVLVECNNSLQAAVDTLLSLSERNQSQAHSASSPRQSGSPEGLLTNPLQRGITAATLCEGLS